MKKKIYFIDLTHKSKLGFGSDTMPLQLGLLGTYCLSQHEDRIDIELFKLVVPSGKSINLSPLLNNCPIFNIELINDLLTFSLLIKCVPAFLDRKPIIGQLLISAFEIKFPLIIE